MATRRPAEAFPPGAFLKEELEARGWTQSDLAEIMDRPVGTINEIITGKRGISPETARGLAAALGTSAEFWMNLDSAFQLWRVGDDDNGVSRRARLYSMLPLKEIIRRGWIEPSESIDVLESRVQKFLQISHIDDEPEEILHAARKSTPYDSPLTLAQRAWLFRARQLADAVQVRPFKEENLHTAIRELRLLTHTPQELRLVPRILSEAGIKFVIVQPLSGTRIDGASFWVDDTPVVALSLRFDRIDNFWFVLMHELGHVAKREGALDTDLEESNQQSNKPQSEIDADIFAVEHLLPQWRVEDFINRVGPLYSSRRIEAFARTMGVHPGIVVGHLQHRREIAYSSFRKALVPVRELVTATAITDGWGCAVPSLG